MQVVRCSSGPSGVIALCCAEEGSDPDTKSLPTTSPPATATTLTSSNMRHAETVTLVSEDAYCQCTRQ